MGWFDPRGLASVVFGLLALEALAGPVAKPAVTVIAFTVLLSVLAHGLSADPLAKRYGPRLIPPPGVAGPAGRPRYPNGASSATRGWCRTPDIRGPLITDQAPIGVGDRDGRQAAHAGLH